MSGLFSPQSFNLDTALSNLSNAFGSLQDLITGISYLVGVTLIIRGLLMYRSFANQTYGSAQRGEIAGPLVFLVVGAVLLYFPNTLQTSLTTVFGKSDIASASQLMAYSALGASEKWQSIANVVVQYMKLIGFIAFIRGWILLSKMGHSGSQPGSIGKGLIHVIGGILLINVVDTVNVLLQTFGYTG